MKSLPAKTPLSPHAKCQKSNQSLFPSIYSMSQFSFPLFPESLQNQKSYRTLNFHFIFTWEVYSASPETRIAQRKGTRQNQRELHEENCVSTKLYSGSVITEQGNLPVFPIHAYAMARVQITPRQSHEYLILGRDYNYLLRVAK